MAMQYFIPQTPDIWLYLVLKARDSENLSERKN